MNFDLTTEQEMIRQEVRRFAQKEIAPRAADIERSGEYPYDIIAKMADLGLMGIPFPEDYGGGGGDWVGMHLQIVEGTSEVQRLVIGRILSGKNRKQ